MTWTAPMTAVSNDPVTAANWNTHVRDNLLETEAAKATGTSKHFVATGVNAITTRTTTDAVVTNTQSTTSTSYTDLATPGPSVSVTTDTTAIVWFSAESENTIGGALQKFSVAVSGATTVAASDDWAVVLDGLYDLSPCRRGSAHRFTGLTAGVNTFTMKYAAGSNTASFGKREIIVMPF